MAENRRHTSDQGQDLGMPTAYTGESNMGILPIPVKRHFVAVPGYSQTSHMNGDSPLRIESVLISCLVTPSQGQMHQGRVLSTLTPRRLVPQYLCCKCRFLALCIEHAMVRARHIFLGALAFLAEAAVNLGDVFLDWSARSSCRLHVMFRHRFRACPIRMSVFAALAVIRSTDATHS